MPKNLFKKCGEPVNRVFLKGIVYEPVVVSDVSRVHNHSFYNNFLTSLLTAFCQLSGGDIRRSF